MSKLKLLLPAFLLLAGSMQLPIAVAADEPLHVEIDRLVEAQFDGPAASTSSDAEFFRRLHLDLTGTIPSAQKTRQFLADTADDKRTVEIDRLLAAPTYADRMADLFHVMLMEQRGDNDEWFRFLKTSFEQNKPWHQLVRDILKPDADDEATRGAAYFYTRRLEKVGQQTTDYPGLTRDVGRLFLGVDLQCAECHDHLFIDDYKQREFQGLFSVYQNVSIRSEKFPAINEKAMGAKLEFVSVFAAGTNNTGPRVPFGKEFEIPEPPALDPNAPKKKPDPNAPPYFSALQLIAEELPSADNRLFSRNIANRVWYSLLGRGLVEPLDQFHSANPPTHPELLDLLAEELVAHEFDLKWFIRELLLSQTWQRSSRIEAVVELPGPQSWRLANQRRLTAAQVFFSTLQATGNVERLVPRDGAEPSEEFKTLQAKFVTAFAAEPKEPATDYTPSVKQALFVLNDSSLLGLLQPQAGNLAERLSALSDQDAVEELFLCIFCRLPDDSERELIEQHLASAGDQRDAMLARIGWAMITSMEFAVNH